MTPAVLSSFCRNLSSEGVRHTHPTKVCHCRQRNCYCSVAALWCCYCCPLEVVLQQAVHMFPLLSPENMRDFNNEEYTFNHAKVNVEFFPPLITLRLSIGRDHHKDRKSLQKAGFRSLFPLAFTHPRLPASRYHLHQR